jgi:hypothetical protein
MSKSFLEAFAMAYNKVHFEKLIMGVGLIAMEWSYIEYVLDRIIESLSGIEDEAISATFAAGSDLRNKINTTKALATIRKQDKEWMKQLNTILDKLGNEYRIKRNSFVHSLWHGKREGMTIRMKRVRFLKL